MHTGFKHISDIFGKRVNITCYFFIAPLHTETGDRCHRIQKKMRTYLQPDTFQFSLLQLDLLLIAFDLQSYDLIHKGIKGILQQRELTVFIILRNTKSVVSLPHMFHLPCHLIHGPQYLTAAVRYNNKGHNKR